MKLGLRGAELQNGTAGLDSGNLRPVEILVGLKLAGWTGEPRDEILLYLFSRALPLPISVFIALDFQLNDKPFELAGI